MTHSEEYEAVRARKRRTEKGDAVRAYHREYARAHRAQVKAYEAKMRAADPEGWKAKAKARMKKWREANPERAKQHAVAAYRKRRRQSPEAVRATNREATRRFRRLNPGAKAVIEQKRKAAKRRCPGSGVTRAQWAMILDAYGHRCAYCAATGKLTMDHVDPLAKGGAHDVANVVPACGSCNSRKHDSSLIVWLARWRAA